MKNFRIQQDHDFIHDSQRLGYHLVAILELVHYFFDIFISFNLYFEIVTLVVQINSYND